MTGVEGQNKATGTTIPPIAAHAGKSRRRRSRRSPRSNSRRASSPTTRKKNVIRKLLTHKWRLWEMPAPPIWMLSTIVQTWL